MKNTSLFIFLGSFILLILIALFITASNPVNLTIPAHSDKPMPMPIERGSSLPVLDEMMPPFQGISQWWNTTNNKPLTHDDLEGKVVFVDFWTYSCINCIRTQPVLRAWWDAYEDKGLIMVGVHTPEFAFEKDPANVEAAILKAGLEYPIALDADYKTWHAYENHYWPAGYLFDAQGRLRYTHFGEGNYEQTEAAIRSLLEEAGFELDEMTGADSTPDFSVTKTPETYYGYRRTESFANRSEFKKDSALNYTLKDVKTNEWSIGGLWQIEDERAIAQNMDSVFQMNVQSNAFHIVLGTPNELAKLRVLIDGRAPSDDQLTNDTVRQEDGSVVITITNKDLYRIARFPDAGRHTVQLKMLDAPIEFYASTFGE